MGTLSTGGNTTQTGSMTCVGISCANSVTLTNRGYGIAFQTASSLSQNSLYTLPSQVGPAGSMLYVAG